MLHKPNMQAIPNKIKSMKLEIQALLLNSYIYSISEYDLWLGQELLKEPPEDPLIFPTSLAAKTQLFDPEILSTTNEVYNLPLIQMV